MFYNYCHALFTWASSSDREGNLILRHDINKLIDWLSQIGRSPSIHSVHNNKKIEFLLHNEHMHQTDSQIAEILESYIKKTVRVKPLAKLTLTILTR